MTGQPLGQDLRVALEVIDILEELGIRYHLGGSIASSIHGMPRQTRDVDLVADLPLSVVPALVSRLQARFYLDGERIRSAIRRRTSFNLIHLGTGLKLDIFVHGTGAFDQAELERQASYRLQQEPPRDVMVKSAEDTVLRKLLWYREGGEISERQWSDVHGILITQKDQLDLGYLKRWAKDLGIEDLFDRALREAGSDPT